MRAQSLISSKNKIEIYDYQRIQKALFASPELKRTFEQHEKHIQEVTDEDFSAALKVVHNTIVGTMFETTSQIVARPCLMMVVQAASKYVGGKIEHALASKEDAHENAKNRYEQLKEQENSFKGGQRVHKEL